MKALILVLGSLFSTVAVAQVQVVQGAGIKNMVRSYRTYVDVLISPIPYVNPVTEYEVIVDLKVNTADGIAILTYGDKRLPYKMKCDVFTVVKTTESTYLSKSLEYSLKEEQVKSLKNKPTSRIQFKGKCVDMATNRKYLGDGEFFLETAGKKFTLLLPEGIYQSVVQGDLTRNDLDSAK